MGPRQERDGRNGSSAEEGVYRPYGSRRPRRSTDAFSAYLKLDWRACSRKVEATDLKDAPAVLE